METITCTNSTLHVQLNINEVIFLQEHGWKVE